MSLEVSRETPSPPDLAQKVFAHTLPTAQAYANLLASDGVLRGLIGPREVPRLWERHLINCALLGLGIPSGRTVCDIGSGAGLPGVVLALRRADLSLTLVEPLLRRATFLSEVVEALGLRHVEVLRARAKEIHGHATFDVVTSRAVAPLDRLTRWSLPLVAPGGRMLAMKGATAQAEVDAHRALIHRLGGRGVAVERFGAHLADPPTTVVSVWRSERSERA